MNTHTGKRGAMGVLQLAAMVNACDASIAAFSMHLDKARTIGNSAMLQILNEQMATTQKARSHALKKIRNTAPETRAEALERLRVLAIVELQTACNLIELRGIARAEINRAFDLASVELQRAPATNPATAQEGKKRGRTRQIT